MLINTFTYLGKKHTLITKSTQNSSLILYSRSPLEKGINIHILFAHTLTFGRHFAFYYLGSRLVCRTKPLDILNFSNITPSSFPGTCQNHIFFAMFLTSKN